MKAKTSLNAGGSATRKTQRNRVSSPWVHKNQSNVVSRGRPKGSNIRSETKLKRKTYEKNLAGVEILTADTLKLQLALESPVSNGNGTTSKRSHRKKTSLHKSLNENSIQEDLDQKDPVVTPASNTTKKHNTYRARKALRQSLNEHELRKEHSSPQSRSFPIDRFENGEKAIEVEESQPISDDSMEVDTTVNQIADAIKNSDTLPNKDPTHWSCNIL